MHEILDKKSLYGRKNFISEKKKKKTITKIFGKKNLFSKSLLRWDDGGTFFRIYKKFGSNNPSILTPTNSVTVAT